MSEKFEEPLKIYVRFSEQIYGTYYPIEPLYNQRCSDIYNKHLMLKEHFEYSNFVPFSHEVKDLSSLNLALTHLIFNPRSPLR